MIAGAGSANPSPTDAELLEAASLGSPRGFERLVERHYGTIYAVAYARTAHREAAEDLAQEVFLRGWLCLKDLRESARFLPWLVRITHNLSTNWQRRQRLVPMVSASGMSAPASPGEAPNGVEPIADQHTPNPREAAVESERERAVRQAILSLPPEQREVILLHYMEDLNQREIAQRLDTHPVAVHRLLQRGLKGMKQSLEPLIRETVPAFRPTRRAVASTVAVIAATTALSIPAKSALAAAEAGIAKAAAVSLVGAGGAATASGVAGSAASTSFFGLLKTIFAGLFTGVKIMGTGKTIGIVAAVAAIAGGGVYYFSDSQSQGLMDANASALEQSAASIQGLPRDVLVRLLAAHKEARAKLDPTGRLIPNTHIYYLAAPDALDLQAVIPRRTDQTLVAGSDFDMGNSTSQMDAVYDEAGKPLKFRQEAVPGSNIPNYHRNIVTIDTPWPAGEERMFIWSIRRDQITVKSPSGGVDIGVCGDASSGYTLALGNDLGPEGIQQFYLVLPPKYRFESASEKPDFEEKISNYMIHGWRKHTAPRESVRINALVKLNPAASKASSTNEPQSDVTPEEAREIKAAFSNYQDAVKQGDQKSMENAWDWEATARYKKSDIATAKKEVGFAAPPIGFSGFAIDAIVTSGEELEGYRKKNNWLPAGKIVRVTSGNWDWYLRHTPSGWKFLIQEMRYFRKNYR